MTPVVMAMESYFTRLNALWKKLGKCLPLHSWYEDEDTALFVGPPEGENMSREWQPARALPPADLPPMCDELRDFFGAWRFWSLSGKLERRSYTFRAIPTDEAARQVAAAAITDGEYYLGHGYVRLASVEFRGNDDLLLLYNQHDGALILLDADKETTTPLPYTLADLIGRMEALL